TGPRLAHDLRGRRPLLRQGREPHRGVRYEGRAGEHARRRLHASAGSALLRAAREAGVRHAVHPVHPQPALDHHPEPKRSAGLLLNSRSSRFPNGLANSSGLVGKYLMDTVGVSVGGFFPALMDRPAHNEDGVGGMHLYMPWWNYQKKMPFPRGYHIEVWGG